MRIALIGTVSSSIFGFRKMLIQSLISQGHDVYVFTTDLTPGLKRKAEQELGVKARSYSLARTGINPVSDLFAMFCLSREFRKLKLDLVFCYFSKPVIFGSLAAKLAGVRRCYGMLEGLGYYFTDDPGGDGLKKKLIRSVQVSLFRLVAPFLNGLIVLNPDDRDDLANKYRIKAHNIFVLGGIGLCLKEYPYSSPPSKPPTFIFVGRLLAEKGINQFLGAAEALKKRYKNANFQVIGGLDEGNPGSVDIDYLSELHDKGIICYPGPVSDVPLRLKASSVFVLPSYYREGVPRSIQEAMSVGRPIITTDSPGCRETVVHGVNGFLIPPHDLDGLILAMEHFIKSPECISSMGIESRKMAEERFNAIEVNERLIGYLDLE